MKSIQWFRAPSRKRGIALIVVVGALALTTVLLIAMFSVTETEYRATQSFVAAQSAKQYADMAVSIVQAQIQNAQNDPTTFNAANRTTHATQPGVATVFNSQGVFLRAHKLYSSSNMVALPSGSPPMKNLVQGKDNSGTLLVPQDWNNPSNKSYRARFVDLNEPVVHSGLSGAPGARSVYFPVIDPRAAFNYTGAQVSPGSEPAYGSNTTKVEGFSYVAAPGASAPSVNASESYTGWASGAATFDGTVAPAAGADPNQLRLPMPVEWMYVLKDGTFGTLNDSGTFIPAPNGSAPTAENPIVGRMGFWTDDESCKININTATEPTFSNSPFYYSDRDRLWAHYPAAAGEYQRYPGHPATTSLSAVLFPAHRLDPYNPEPGMTKAQIVELKNAIYDLAPKVGPGGSQAGTVPFVVDEVNGFGDSKISVHVDLVNALTERLYASVDEMLFKDGVFSSGTGRAAAAINAPGGSRQLFDHDTLERSRFFLTAQSRAPEFSIHGLPRICMWPVGDESKGPTWRTNFDNMIALCASLRSVKSGASTAKGDFTYFFRRLDPHHATADITGAGGTVWDGGHRRQRNDNSATLARNSKLLDFLDKELAGLSYPKTSSGQSSTFQDKYGQDNIRNLAVEIFDYIRCTNLYDGVQARWNNGDLTGKTQSDKGNFGPRYDFADDKASERYTYTNQRATPSWTGDDDKTGSVIADAARTSDDTSVLPGHGTVTPAAWLKDNKVYRGFGRFVTLSEIGLHFICTADGYTTPYNPNAEDVPYSVGSSPAGSSKAAGFGADFDKLSGGASALRCAQDENKFGAAGPPRDFEALPNSSGKVGSLQNCNILQTANAQWWSNFPPLSTDPAKVGKWENPKTGGKILTDYYGCDVSKPANPTTNPKHPSYHPGLYPENWNLTLAVDTPLEPQNASGEGGEKRVQATIDLETFCPTSGWTKFYPEFTIVLDGDYIAQIKLQSGTGPKKRLFNTSGNIPLKSNDNSYEHSGIHSLGGHSSPASLLTGRSSTAFGVDGDGLPCYAINDPEYDSSPSRPRAGLNNYPLNSNFMTVLRDKPMVITFPGAPMQIKIYDTHDWQNHNPVQIIAVRFPDINAPTPVLASPRGKVNNFRVYPDGVSSLNYYRAYQGPHWWVYNSLGCIGLRTGKPSAAWTDGGGAGFWAQGPDDVKEPNIPQVTRGRLHNQIAAMKPNPGGGGGVDITQFANNGSNPDPDGVIVSLPFEIQDGTNTTRVDIGAEMTRRNIVQAASVQVDRGVDVVRTMVPGVGDYRTIAARYEVPETMWVPHPMWKAQAGLAFDKQVRTIHSYTGHWGNTEPGFKLAVEPTSTPVANVSAPRYTLASGAYFDTSDHFDRQADLPGQAGWAAAANSFGDFDTTIANGREGPYINKPDEGNFYAGVDTRTVNGKSEKRFYRSAYFGDASDGGGRQSDDWRNGVYMTPNRMVSSPVMFGSLSTGIWNNGGSLTASQSALNSGGFAPETGINANTYPARPWQTLLFRPHSVIPQSSSSVASKSVHPGQLNPMDHYVLDLFFMPVVEPYAISEPLSVAGRLNMNYQILPFTNIRRATGMHALMKGEYLTSIPSKIGSASGIVKMKARKGFNQTLWDTFQNEIAQGAGDGTDNVYIHRPVNVTETLAQFDERFKLDTGVPLAAQGPFRSASQICELHLIPAMGQRETGAAASSPASLRALNATNRQGQMNNFWANNPATGDNIRERPYANIYSRITTRSNTFRVHVRAQVIKKARSTSPTVFDVEKDTVLSEYRGSTLLERYIDPNDTNNPATAVPDYAALGNPLGAPPLDTFYRYRVLETKRFNP